MEKTLKKMYLTILVNLILWLAVWGAMEKDREFGDMLVIVGVGFSALAQHWAYYACYMKAKGIASSEP